MFLNIILTPINRKQGHYIKLCDFKKMVKNVDHSLLLLIDVINLSLYINEFNLTLI